MSTPIFDLQQNGRLAEDQLADVVAALNSGECVVLPADTGYMLAVDAASESAVEKLFEFKGRPFNNPVHVAVHQPSEIGRYGEVNDVAERLIRRFMPGPITLVLKDLGVLPQRLAAGTSKLGVRIPESAVVLQVCAALGRPLTATSANPAGVPPSNSIEEVAAVFEGRIRCAVRTAGFRYSKPSTVVAFDQGKLVVLREGPISAEEIAAAAR